MARKLGYGGLANSPNRNFSGKTPATGAAIIAMARTTFRFAFARVFGRVN
jgi:hypothetical protein